jgi:DNA-directed RNA polymerase subunit alpha
MRIPPQPRKSVDPLQQTKSTQEEAKEALEEKLATNLSETSLKVRTCNMLEDKSILTVEDLLNCHAKDLMQIPNFGEKTLAEVYEMLEGLGFYRKGHEPNDTEEAA